MRKKKGEEYEMEKSSHDAYKEEETKKLCKRKQLTKAFLTLCIISIFLITIPASAFDIPFFGDDKIKKHYKPETKTISLLNDKSKVGIEITVLSVTQDIDRFEEVFEVSAIGENYDPAELTDFLLRYEDKNKKDVSSKITSETWYYQETIPYTISVPDYNETTIIGYHNEIRYKDAWTELNNLKKIKKGESTIFKLVLTKKVTLGEDAILIIPTFMSTEVEEMTWWSESWKSKSVILINNTGNATNLIDYQVALNVTYDSDMNVDFSDLRVINETSASTVPFWNESAVQGSYINIWFNASYIAASSWTNDTYFLYYNNSGASSVSDGVATFEFFDDFEDGDVSDWYAVHDTPLMEAVEDPVYRGTYSYHVAADVDAEYSGKNMSSIDNFAIHFQVRSPETNTNKYPRTGTDYDNPIRVLNLANDGHLKHYTGAAWVNFPTDTTYLEDTWYDVEIRVQSSADKFEVLWNGTSIGSNLWDTTFTPNACDIIMIGVSAPGNVYIDQMFVCKYVSPEPTAQLGLKYLVELPSHGITEYNTQRKLVRTSEGYLHRVYVSSNRVYYGRSIDNGNNWVETVLTDAGVNNTYPSIAGDSDDNLWVFYEREDSGIRYRVWRGTSWQSEQTLTSDSGEVPVVAVDSDDNIHVGYMVNVSGVYQINYTYYNGTGWNETNEISTDLEDQKYPTIAIDSNDYIHVAFQGYNSTSKSYNIKYRKYTTSWQSIYNITSGEVYNQTFPSIAVDLSDYIHVVWQTYDLKVNYIKYTTSWESVEEVCDGAGYAQYNPSVSIYSTNYVYVTWFGKTATYNETYVIREKHYSGSWSAITDVLHPAGKNVTYPGSISALHPIFCNNCYSNIPLTGFSFIYDEDDGTVKYYNSSTWRCPDKYVLTVIARDISTNQVINNFTALLSTGETGTASYGAVKFTCLDTGYYDVTVSSSLYHSAQQSIVLDMSKEVIIYLVSITEEDYYAKITHQVEFRVRDWWGNPIAGVNVTADITNITMPWSWIQELLGYGDEVDIQNTTLNGFTDSNGRITFMMVQTVEYTITFVKTTQDVNETLVVYPRDTQYTIIVNPTWSYTVGDYVSWNLSTSQHNATHINLSLVYDDSILNETPSLWFYVKDENRTQVYSEHFIYNETVAVNYSVEDVPWDGYLWGFNATHTTYGTLTQDKLITFRDEEGVRVDLNIDNENYYTWFSVAILILLSTLFSVTVSRFGYIIIPFFSLFFWYIGWLAISHTLVLTALMLGVLLYIGRTEREKGL